MVTSGEKKMGYRNFMGDNPSLYPRIIKHGLLDNSPFIGIFQPYRGAISTNVFEVSQSRLPSWEPARASEEAGLCNCCLAPKKFT